jgi:hypothetical protein
MYKTLDNIRGALDSQLTTFANANNLEVAWINTQYEPKVGTPFCRVYYSVSGTGQATLGETGYDRTFGLYEIRVYGSPYKGAKRIFNLIDLLTESFKRGTVLTYNGTSVVVRKVTPGIIIEEPNWFSMSLMIEWEINDSYE